VGGGEKKSILSVFRKLSERENFGQTTTPNCDDRLKENRTAAVKIRQGGESPGNYQRRKLSQKKADRLTRGVNQMDLCT